MDTLTIVNVADTYQAPRYSRGYRFADPVRIVRIMGEVLVKELVMDGAILRVARELALGQMREGPRCFCSTTMLRSRIPP